MSRKLADIEVQKWLKELREKQYAEEERKLLDQRYAKKLRKMKHNKGFGRNYFNRKLGE